MHPKNKGVGVVMDSTDMKERIASMIKDFTANT